MPNVEFRRTYKYEALPTTSDDEHLYVRTLALKPALSTRGRLQAKLQICRLDEIDGEFEALSYVWGKPVFSRTILIDGKVLKITKNLHDFLGRLRPIGKKTRPVWVDAICINQADVKERTAQVAIMGKIYSSAMRTVGWLGYIRDTGAIHDFFREEAARTRNERHDPPRDTLQRFEAIAKAQSREGAPALSSHSADEDQSTLHAYLGRRWIVQEVLLAKDLIFVSHTSMLAGGDLRTVFFAVARDGHRGATERVDPLSHDGAARNLANPGSSNILDLMTYFEHTDCADARDRIAALQGLWRGCNEAQRAFKIDYAQTVESNYISFASMLAQTAECGQLLYLALSMIPTSKQTHRTLPSWVPDWRGDYIPYLHGDVPSIHMAYGASLGIGTTLVVRGWLVDTISGYGSYSGLLHTVSGLERVRKTVVRRYGDVVEGGKICILKTGRMLDAVQFVLRPSGLGHGKFRLVCICDWTWGSLTKFRRDQQWNLEGEAEEIILE